MPGALSASGMFIRKFKLESTLDGEGSLKIGSEARGERPARDSEQLERRGEVF